MELQISTYEDYQNHLGLDSTNVCSECGNYNGSTKDCTECEIEKLRSYGEESL